MKIIDLLNKIANGEEINKFKYYGGTYIYDKETHKYWYEDMWFDLDFCNLNEKVEIIEEDKKIEQIPYQFNLDYIHHNLNETLKDELNKTINGIYDKINELIDEINKLKENK